MKCVLGIYGVWRQVLGTLVVLLLTLSWSCADEAYVDPGQPLSADLPTTVMDGNIPPPDSASQVGPELPNLDAGGAQNDSVSAVDTTVDPPDTCVANCAGKVCGDNGCGGSCGTCGAGLLCETGVCVAPPNSCGAGAQCAPDEVETQACGNCGTQTRTCDNQCQWSGWSMCNNQKVCAPGQVKACGCGSQLCNAQCEWETCVSNCEWWETCQTHTCQTKNPLPYLRSPGPAIPSAFLAPPQYVGAFDGSQIGAGDPYWYHTQWSIPESVNPAQPGGGCVQAGFGYGPFTWGVGNTHASMCWNENGFGEDGYSVALWGSGKNGLACGAELDVFLSPTTPNYAQSVQGAGLDYGIVQDAPSLDQHVSLILEFGAKIGYADVKVKCSQGNPNAPCGLGNKVDYGGAMVAVILENEVTKQIFFYQIYLYDTRPASCGPDTCGSEEFWFDAGSQPFNDGTTWYGATHTIGYYNAPCLTPGGPGQKYALNLLPQLKKLLSKGPPALNPGIPPVDAASHHWRLTQMYVGTVLVGAVELNSVWYDIDLIGYGNW